MERFQKLELLKRSLGLRHKLKVHESMKAPETHEELALMLMAKWELEDELRAIEELLSESRHQSVAKKRTMIEKDYLGPHPPPEPDLASSPAEGAKKKGKR